MPNLKLITCTRYLNQVASETSYLATVQADGYVYFNDNIFFRCLNDLTKPQVWYTDKNNWVDTTLIQEIRSQDFNASGIIGGGTGQTPPPAADGSNDLEKAVIWMIDIANDDSHGYNAADDSCWGPDYRCSSLIAAGLRNGGGFNVPLDSNLTRTTQLRDTLVGIGFKWYAGMGNDSSQLLRGDILLSIGNHTECYIGAGQNVSANINEYGGLYNGRVGDQTGAEIRVQGWYSYPWDGVLRWEG